MDASYQGYYINLDRSTARRAAIEAQLSSLRIAHRYRRFAGADGNSLGVASTKLRAGEIGCFTSHALLLQQAAQEGRHLHVIEDDVVLAPIAAAVLDHHIAQGVLERFDLVYTDSLIWPDSRHLGMCKRLFDECVAPASSGESLAVRGFVCLDLANMVFACTSSYLASNGSLARVGTLLRDALESDPQIPVDLYLRKLLYDGKITATCIFPFVTSITLSNDSTIPERYASHVSVLAANIARQSFFLGRDWRRLAELAASVLPRPVPDPHRKLLSRVLDFATFGDFRPF